MIPLLAILHGASSRGLFTGPLHGASSRGLFTGPLHGASSRGLFTGPLHGASSRGLFTGPLHGASSIKRGGLFSRGLFTSGLRCWRRRSPSLLPCPVAAALHGGLFTGQPQHPSTTPTLFTGPLRGSGAARRRSPPAGTPPRKMHSPTSMEPRRERGDRRRGSGTAQMTAVG